MRRRTREGLAVGPFLNTPLFCAVGMLERHLPRSPATCFYSCASALIHARQQSKQKHKTNVVLNLRRHNKYSLDHHDPVIKSTMHLCLVQCIMLVCRPFFGKHLAHCVHFRRKLDARQTEVNSTTWRSQWLARHTTNNHRMEHDRLNYIKRQCVIRYITTDTTPSGQRMQSHQEPEQCMNFEYQNTKWLAMGTTIELDHTTRICWHTYKTNKVHVDSHNDLLTWSGSHHYGAEILARQGDIINENIRKKRQS